MHNLQPAEYERLEWIGSWRPDGDGTAKATVESSQGASASVKDKMHLLFATNTALWHAIV